MAATPLDASESLGVPALLICFPRGGSGRDQDRTPPAELLKSFGWCPAHRSVHPLDSTIELRLNGTVLHGEHVLELGDVLRLGDTLLVYAWTVGATCDTRTPDGLVGSSVSMTAVRRSIEMVSARRHAVVVTGETGTGKEVVAKLIHDRSGRHGPFIAMNCSTFTDDLLASELFGHVKGAFTGAVNDHSGLFRAARGGTLLLDELADIPMPVQAALLRALETRCVRPVGGAKDVDTDVRIIATSHSELVDLVQQGSFRADLYARLAQWTIRTPPLHEHREDIPELTGYLLPLVEGSGRRLSPDLCEALLIHEWPLNVRGLLNILSIAVISAPDDVSPLDLSIDVRDALRRTRRMAPNSAPEPAKPAVNAAPAPEWAPHRVFSEDTLREVMTHFQGQVAAASRHLGTTRPTFYRMLKLYEIDPADYRPVRHAAHPGRGRDASTTDRVLAPGRRSSG